MVHANVIEVEQETTFMSKVGSFFKGTWSVIKWTVFLPWRMVKGTYNMFRHPIDTIHSISDTIRGIIIVTKSVFCKSITNYKGGLDMDLDVGEMIMTAFLSLFVGFYIWIILLACGLTVAASLGVMGVAAICGTGIMAILNYENIAIAYDYAFNSDSIRLARNARKAETVAAVENANMKSLNKIVQSGNIMREAKKDMPALAAAAGKSQAEMSQLINEADAFAGLSRLCEEKGTLDAEDLLEQARSCGLITEGGEEE